MRLDKFLKVSRLVKRRPVAKEMADRGRIDVNGKTAKSGTKLAVGDELLIRFSRRQMTVEVLELKDSAKKVEAQEMYKILDEQYEDREEPEFF